MNKVPITRDGLEKLRQELQNIITVERPRNLKAIEEARAHGDLSENAEYHAAKERQSFLEARLNELEAAINRSEVIDTEQKQFDRVIFGATVDLINLKTDQEVTYQLIGPYESDPDSNKISVTSPLGKSLIGKEEGDIVKVKTPGGFMEYEILDIR